MRLHNLLARLPPAGDQESIDTLLERPGVRIERIVSHGHASPPGFWYDQAEDEWVLLLSGAARIEIEGEQEDRALAPGDTLLLAAHCRHRVSWTDPDRATVWLAVFIAPGASELA